jgi:hypothetical protein
MPCEKYQDALIDLAAEGAEPAGDVRAHLNACVLCRAYVEQERSLLAAIDSGVRRSTNAPLPPAVLQRFEAHLAQQAQPNRVLNLRWLYTGAAFATATVFIVFALPHLRSHVTLEQSTDVSQAAHAAIEQAQEARPMAPLFPPGSPLAAYRLGKHSATPGTITQPELLVPPEERVAFEHFLSDLNGREDLAAAIVKPIHAQREQRVISLDTPDIEIAALTVEPIQDGSDR